MWKKEPPTADEVRARMDAWGLAWAPYIARSSSGVLVMQEQLTVCDGVVVQLYGVSQLPHGREWYAVPTPDEVAARDAAAKVIEAAREQERRHHQFPKEIGRPCDCGVCVNVRALDGAA